LLVANAPVEAEVARTHSGLMSAFSQHIVSLRRGPSCERGLAVKT
jgi:transcriptional regulator of NAD metabolism